MKRIIKKIGIFKSKAIFAFYLLLLFVFCPCISAHLNNSKGVYVGLDVGYGRTNYGKVDLFYGVGPSAIRDDGIVPKLNVGYDFNAYIGLELSVIYFQKPVFEGLGNTKISGKIKHNLVFLAVKPMLPLPHAFTIYLKLGGGYIVRDALLVRQNDRNIQALTEGGFYRPVFGMGLNYQVAPHWLLDLTWIQALGRYKDRLPASRFYGVGAIYKF